LGYLQNHKDRMRYAEYRREGLPIVSSYVESAVKQFNQRVKGTEKFWREAGAEEMLQLRADYLTPISAEPKSPPWVYPSWVFFRGTGGDFFRLPALSGAVIAIGRLRWLERCLPRFPAVPGAIDLQTTALPARICWHNVPPSCLPDRQIPPGESRS
jgi:hypothetical protein